MGVVAKEDLQEAKQKVLQFLGTKEVQTEVLKIQALGNRKKPEIDELLLKRNPLIQLNS